MKDINEVLLNPTRMRIIQQLALRQSMTANEICGIIREVPRTTLYRHINIMIESGVVSVVSENKVRGSLERTLALNIGRLQENNSLANASQNVLSFLMNRYARYHAYFHGSHPQPGMDIVFWNTTVMMMDDAEFGAFLSELQQLLVKYSFEDNGQRKARDISVLSVPVID